jgi:hypothetical protein
MKTRIATGRTLTGLLAILFAQAAFATPPAAPVVTVGAGLKQLQFDWNYVPRAGHYEVWFRSNPGAAWAKFADTPSWRPRANVNISAHLLHWVEARYVIKACNPSGCTSSSEIDVSQLMKDSVGYFKASTPASAGPWGLGRNVAMSEDGSTVAAGGGARGGFGADGTVVVFRKNSTRWVEEAQLLPSVRNQERGGGSTSELDINGDGTVIVLGAPEEVRPDTDAGEFPEIGAVYVFRRTANGWVQEQRLASADFVAEDAFGRHVDLDESGTLLAVWRRWGVSESFGSQGHVELFRHTSAGWVPLATIRAINDECQVMALSGDGLSLARACGDRVDVLTAPDWQRVAQLPNAFAGTGPMRYARRIAISHDGRIVAARTRTVEFSDEVYRTSVTIYRQGASGWIRETAVTPGDWVPREVEDYSPADYGGRLSISRDGRFLAVGSAGDNAAGTGVRYPPFFADGSGSQGAVYVYERRPTGWRLRQFIKPNPGATQFLGFGAAVSFARNGKDLAVGAPGDLSNALGIDGDQDDTSAPNRGAVWVY